MKERRKTSLMSVAISVIMIICSASSVFAYKPPNAMEIDPAQGEKAVPLEANQTAAFMENSSFLNDIGLKEVMYDFQFTDMDENIYKADEVTGLKNCVHNYVNGRYQEHIKNEDGSCKVNIYSARRCTKCYKVEKQSLQSSTTFPKCTH